MKDDPNRPRERERLAAQQAVDNAVAQLDGTPHRETGEVRGGLLARLEKLEADVEATRAEVARLQEVIEANEATLAEIEAEYGAADEVAGEGQGIAGADVAEAAWLAGEGN